MRAKSFVLCLFSHNYFEQEIRNAIFFAQFTNVYRCKFTGKLAITLFCSDKPVNPHKQEHTRCPSQPKAIKASPLLRLNRTKKHDTSSNFTKIELYRSKKGGKKEKTGNPATTTSLDHIYLCVIEKITTLYAPDRFPFQHCCELQLYVTMQMLESTTAFHYPKYSTKLKSQIIRMTS